MLFSTFEKVWKAANVFFFVTVIEKLFIGINTNSKFHHYSTVRFYLILLFGINTGTTAPPPSRGVIVN